MNSKKKINFIKALLRPLKSKLSIIKNILLLIPIRKFNSYNSFIGQPIFAKSRGFVFWLSQNTLFSFSIRPKHAKDLMYMPSHSNYLSTGICIQGPIGKNNRIFLENTVLIYKKLYPKVKIVISTWENEKENISENLQYLCDSVVINKYPENLKPGIDNINFQIYSTLSGLKKLNEIGCEFSIKQRTDCRFYNPNTLNMLHNFFKVFPSEHKKEINRIFSCNIGSLKYRPYCLGDIMLFGKTEKLINYFSSEEYEVSLKKLGVKDTKIPLINNTIVTVETFLCARYLQSIGHEPNFTIEDWYNCLKKYFLIFDASQIDFFFNKKNPEFEQRAEKNYSNIDNENLNFSDWLNSFGEEKNFWSENYREKWTYNINDSYPKKIKR